MRSAAVTTGVVVLLCALVLAARGQSPGKKLIEFGWDEPDPRFMREHITALQASPFDGCVFHVGYRKSDGSPGNFSWDVWGHRRFTARDLDSARGDLIATRFGRFHENFLRVNVTPGDLGWFANHDTVMANLELAARLAKQAGCPGILFDVEQYKGPLWDYHAQTRAHACSWDSLALQVRRRGTEAMAAFERGYPGLTVFMTWAYSMPIVETLGGRKALADTHDGLLVPFLDGMIAAASDSTVIVDGNELSYPFREPARFAAQADSMRHGALRSVAQPARYARRLSVGFGTWLDYDWSHRGWDSHDPSKNYFTPAAFAVAVQAALDHADRYVWIYSEKPRWWSPAGGPVELPAAYDSVLRSVHR